MARNFTAAFKTMAAKKGASFYRVLEIDWGGTTGTKYYLDRPGNSFLATGQRIPASGVDASVLVTQWPSCSLELHEGQVGFQQQSQVVLNDAAGALTSILNIEDKQRKLVTVWLLFDDASTVWPTDAAQVFTGVLRPFDWKGSSNELTLNLGDLGPLLAKSISIIADPNIFSGLPGGAGGNTANDTTHKQLPLCWGYAQRVEAICVQKPWSTTITQSTDGSSPVTVTIADDPQAMGIPSFSQLTTYQAYLGLDSVNVQFTRNEPPAASTATITKNWDQVLATAVILGTTSGSGAAQIIIQDEHIQPSDIGHTLTTYVGAGTNVQVVMAKYGIYATTLATIITNSPWQGWYTLNFSDPSGIIAANLQIGDTVKFLKNGTPMRAWPVGTVLRALNTESVYVANALPSKNVARVEGFGSVTDQAGANRKDFITLGSYKYAFIAGSSTTTITGTSFTVNLNDNTWNNPPGTLLGQNVTTITFPGTPRDLNNNLDDDRIWVTLQGVEDVGNSTGNLISNPNLIILQYLENTHLMNVATGSINAASFTAAAADTYTNRYYCGFAQVEAVDGLSLLQHIAQLCHSVLFFDQGQANIVQLPFPPGTAGTIVHTFDTTTNDNILQGSLEVSEIPVDDIVNDVSFKWRGFWDDKTGNKLLDNKQVSLTSVAALGRISREINPVDIYWRRQDVTSECSWWLPNLASIWRTVKFTGFLDAIILQPGDWISVTWIDGGGRNYWNGPRSMMVTKITDTGKDGLVEIEAKYVEFYYS